MIAKSPEEAVDLEDGLVSGRLWDEYCDAIKRVGRHLLRPEAPHDVFNQAEGMRYLTRMVRAGLELMVEAGTPEFPRFSDPAGGFIKIGGDNPDNVYLSAPIRGDLEYRIHGRRGDAPTINFATKNGGCQKPGAKMLGTGFLDGRELEVDEGGNFEILASARRPPQPGRQHHDRGRAPRSGTSELAHHRWPRAGHQPVPSDRGARQACADQDPDRQVRCADWRARAWNSSLTPC